MCFIPYHVYFSQLFPQYQIPWQMRGFWRISTPKPPKTLSSTRHRHIRFTTTNSAISSTSTNTGQNTSPKAQGRTAYSSLSVASKTNPGSAEQAIFRDRSKGTIYLNHKVNQDFNRDGTSLWAMGLFFWPHLSRSDSITPLRHYQNLIDKGVLRGDNRQTCIIQILQDLHDKLVHYKPPEIPSTSESNSLVSNSHCFRSHRELLTDCVLFPFPSLLGYLTANPKYPFPLRPMPQKACTYMVMSELERQCLWIFSFTPSHPP